MTWRELQTYAANLIAERAKANGVAARHISDSTMRRGGISATRSEVILALRETVVQDGPAKIGERFCLTSQAEREPGAWQPLSEERIAYLIGLDRTAVIYWLKKARRIHSELVHAAPDYSI